MLLDRADGGCSPKFGNWRGYSEHLAEAAKFERMAKDESNPALKEQLLKQDATYYKLAEERAQALGQPLPPKPSRN